MNKIKMPRFTFYSKKAKKWYTVRSLIMSLFLKTAYETACLIITILCICLSAYYFFTTQLLHSIYFLLLSIMGMIQSYADTAQQALRDRNTLLVCQLELMQALKKHVEE